MTTADDDDVMRRDFERMIYKRCDEEDAEKAAKEDAMTTAEILAAVPPRPPYSTEDWLRAREIIIFLTYPASSSDRMLQDGLDLCQRVFDYLGQQFESAWNSQYGDNAELLQKELDVITHFQSAAGDGCVCDVCNAVRTFAYERDQRIIKALTEALVESRYRLTTLGISAKSPTLARIDDALALAKEAQ